MYFAAACGLEVDSSSVEIEPDDFVPHAVDHRLMELVIFSCDTCEVDDIVSRAIVMLIVLLPSFISTISQVIDDFD